MPRAVIDAGVFVDYFVKVRGCEECHMQARSVIERLSELACMVYEPFILEIELSAVLVRHVSDRDVVRSIVRRVLRHVVLVPEEELHELALGVALSTRCRAVDAYYVLRQLRSLRCL